MALVEREQEDQDDRRGQRQPGWREQERNRGCQRMARTGRMQADLAGMIIEDRVVEIMDDQQTLRQPKCGQ